MDHGLKQALKVLIALACGVSVTAASISINNKNNDNMSDKNSEIFDVIDETETNNHIVKTNENIIKYPSDIFLTGSDYPNNSKNENKKITVLTNERFGQWWTTYPTDKILKTPLKKGETYTFSAEIKTKNLYKNGVLLELCLRTPSVPISEYYTKADYTAIRIPPNKNNKWLKLKGTFTYTDTQHEWIVFDITSGGANTTPATGFKDVEIEYRNFKLETGKNATEYID